MTPARASLPAQLRAPFWSYHPLRPIVRRVLLVLVAIIIVGDSLLRASADQPTSVLSAIVSTAMTVVIALFAWRPPAAAVALMVGAVVATVTGTADDFLLGAALMLGLVAVTCSAALTLAYAVVMTAWGIVEVVRPDEPLAFAGAVVIALIGGVSVLIGITLRQQRDRWRALAAQVAENEREAADQLRHERDLIADELHDIVAHEITIVALHAAVLDRTDDTQMRQQSQTAIREAAVQALTDIRRVLGMVRGDEGLDPDRLPAPDSLESIVAAAARELETTGIKVEVTMPAELKVPSAAQIALIRVVRESATNVLKHATGARHVRIAVTVERGWARLEFADDSPPAHTAGLPASGYGIMRLRERFRLFGGTFSAERRRGEWVVTASLPLTE